jgi:hypothetical protein
MAMQKQYRFAAQRLSELVNRALDPLIAIVGARLAAICEPTRLNWPPRAKNRAADAPAQAATLMLRVEPGFGLDVQHLTGALIDRVNAYVGWRCVARISIRQEPLRRASPRKRREAPRNEKLRARAEAETTGIVDEGLRRALTTLGERTLAQRSAD